MKLNYIKHKLINLLTINKIVTIHYHELDRDFSFEGESHNFWELVYVDSGQVAINANARLFHLKSGELIFHKPNEFHTLRADNKTASNVFVISFVCSSEAMHFFKEKTMTLPPKLKKHISSIIKEYNETFVRMSVADTKLEMKENPPIGSQQMIRLQLEQLLIMLIRHEQETRDLRVFPSKESMENHLVTQILDIIEKHKYEQLSVEQICRKLSYSRAYLTKIFKETTDYTILEYILIEKIKEAKRLIREGHLNFTQIADKLAFDNPQYFSRVFKRMTNMTPSDYKNSAIKH